MWALKPKGFIESIGSWGRIHTHGWKGLCYLGIVALIGSGPRICRFTLCWGIVGLRLTDVCVRSF